MKIAAKNPALRTQAELADKLGVKPRRVREMLALGMPWKPGESAAAAIAWVGENVNRRGSGSLSEKRLRAEIRKINEHVRMQQLRRLLFKKELVRRFDIEQDLLIFIGHFRGRLEELPDRLESGFPSECRADSKYQCQNIIDGILRELSQWDAKNFTIANKSPGVCEPTSVKLSENSPESPKN